MSELLEWKRIFINELLAKKKKPAQTQITVFEPALFIIIDELMLTHRELASPWFLVGVPPPPWIELQTVSCP